MVRLRVYDPHIFIQGEKEIIPWAFKKVGYDVFVDFREKAVSEKPDRYWEIAENDLPKYVKGANLNNRNLTNADMYKAFLVNAHLHHAIVDGAYLIQEAKLGEANLQEANFIGAVNLTIEQLSKAKTLYQAKLDPELLGQVKKCCPHLLEKPKEETDKKDETK